MVNRRKVGGLKLYKLRIWENNMEIKLEELKRQYAEIQKKYDLPSFEEINPSFELEKIDRETEILVKLIRRLMIEKIINVMSFIEMLMNPAQAPRMYHPFFKVVTEKDQKMMGDIYEKMAELIFSSLENDSEYVEKKEAMLIKEIFSKWGEISGDLDILIKRIKNPGEAVKKNREYFG